MTTTPDKTESLIAQVLADGSPDAPTVVIGRKELERLRACEDVLVAIATARRSMSDGPYAWGIIPSGHEQEETIAEHFKVGTGDVHMIGLPEHPGSVIGDDPSKPDHWKILCMTGNGPMSAHNATNLIEILERIRAWEATQKAEFKL